MTDAKQAFPRPHMLSRRQIVAGGSAALLGAASCAKRAPAKLVAHAGDALPARAAAALARLSDHFFDSAHGHIRPTNGGGGPPSGLVDTGLPFPSFWEMECFHNCLFNDWQAFGSAASRDRIASQWRYIRSVPAFTPRVLAGDGAPGVTIYTFDDAVWQADYLMQVHQVTGDRLALAYMAEVVAGTPTRFRDPDGVHNPAIRFGTSPNLANIDYGLGRGTAKGGFRGQPFEASRYGLLYTLPSRSNWHSYGKVGSTFEAGMGLLSLYLHQALGASMWLAYAEHVFAVCKRFARTPDPHSTPYPRADGVGPQPPSDPAKRKAGGIYECQWCLNPSGGTGADSDAPFLGADEGFYGKPVRNLDSTYLGGAIMVALLGARLHRVTGNALYSDEALSIARAIISPQAYGRLVGGRTLIGNTRDPHSEGQFLVPFAAEVLTLPGAPLATRRALRDTAAYVLDRQVTPDGYLTADWAGPEFDPDGRGGKGSWTWEQDYAFSPGTFAGARQIMTSSQTMAMVQAGALIAEQDAEG